MVALEDPISLETKVQGPLLRMAEPDSPYLSQEEEFASVAKIGNASLLERFLKLVEIQTLSNKKAELFENFCSSEQNLWQEQSFLDGCLR